MHNFSNRDFSQQNHYDTNKQLRYACIYHISEQGLLVARKAEG